MKKYILLISFAFIGVLNAQIRVNGNVSNGGADGSTAFLDASSSKVNNATTNIGKGLIFPRVDLVELKSLKVKGRAGLETNYPSNMDGMVVYNTVEGTPGIGASVTANVTPGFYYYENKSKKLEGGHWVRIGGGESAVATGVNNGHFWSLKGNEGTQEAQLQDKDAGNYTITGGNFIGTTDAKSLTFATNNVARLIIGKEGGFITETVGSRDFDFVLKVLGKAKFDKGLVTSASTYPDYVFDNYFTGKSDENPNYQFRKLHEVEQFIKENNHLPGVTSIKELTKSETGYDVDNTKLSIQTLEKVEELYLHVIEQQKEIQALKAEIAELKK